MKEIQSMLKNIKIKIDQDGKALMPVEDEECHGEASTSNTGNNGADEEEMSNLPYKVIGKLVFLTY